VHVAGVDGRHHERRHPQAERLVQHGLGARRLARAFEAGRQRERVAQQVQHAGVGGGGGHRRLQAGGGAPEKVPFILRTRPRTRLAGVAEAGLHLVLQHEHAQVERDRIEAAGEHDARTAGPGLCLVGVDHLAHPGRFATQVHVVDAAGGTGGHQFVAIELVGAHGGQHQPGLRHQRLQAGRVGAVGDDQRGVGRRAHFVAHGRQLGGAAPAHGPAQAACRGSAAAGTPPPAGR
jgi:hypothetical protein